MSGRVVGAGYHDTSFRWDISTPQPCIGRLMTLPVQGGGLSQPGRTLFASRDRFGKWDHFLGPRHAMLAWVVEARGERIRRLEVQAHLGSEGEDDLCPVGEFEGRYQDLLGRMGLYGVLPSEDPRVVRVDVAVDVEYADSQEGWRVLEALRFARWPRGWYAEWQGPPPYTTVAVKSGTKTIARAYCRNSKLRNGRERWGKIRFEREHRFDWAHGRQVSDLSSSAAAAVYWGSTFGHGAASGRVTRLAKEVEAVELMERVALGEITTGQYEQLLAFLTAERLGLVERIYSKETARRRRGLARQLGVSPGDAEVATLDVSLDDAMATARSAWRLAA